MVKNPPAMQKTQETRVRSLGGEDPLEKEMATTPVFLPEEFHGQRILLAYHGITESVTTEQLTYNFQTLDLFILFSFFLLFSSMLTFPL